MDKLPPAPAMSPSKAEAKNQGKDGLEAPLSTPRLDGIKKTQAAGLSAKPIESVPNAEDGRGSEKVSLPSIGGGASLTPKGAYSLAPAPSAPMGEGKNEDSLAPPMPLPEGAEIKGAKGKAGLLPLGDTGSKKKKKKKNKKKGTF